VKTTRLPGALTSLQVHRHPTEMADTISPQRKRAMVTRSLESIGMPLALVFRSMISGNPGRRESS
jgi:hypothetical protein